MVAPQTTRIETKAQMVNHLMAGCKPKSAWRIGTEHEKIVFCDEEKIPLTYEATCGVRALLEGLTRYGWAPVYEGDNVCLLYTSPSPRDRG